MVKTNEICPMIDKRLVIALLFLLASRFIGGPVATAQTVPINHEYEYKAAYLYHFARLCRWPGEETERIVIGLLGDPRPFGRHLRRIQTESENRSRGIEVRVFPNIDSFRAQGRACQMLFVMGKDARAEQLELLRQAIEATTGQAMLIFTENRDFAEQGAAVNFYIDRNRLMLRINLGAADEAGVEIPQRLLNLKSVDIMPPAAKD